jgi:hypothetical protein
MIPISPNPWSLMLPGNVADPGFEGTAIDWRVEPGGAAQMFPTAAHSGKQSFRLWTYFGGDINVHQSIAVEANRDYRVSIWGQQLCGQPEVSTRIFLFDGFGRNYQAAEFPPGPCGEWRQLQSRFTGNGSGFVELYLNCGHCAQGVLWDDLQIESL